MRKIILLLSLFLSVSFAPHPFYLGVCDLKYNELESKFEATVKVFTNDLEDALKRLGHPGADLLHPKNKKELESWLESYLTKRLSIQLNGKELNLKVLGFENEEESSWIYLESLKCETPIKMELKNEILYDFLQEQMNIVNVEKGGKVQSIKLVNPVKEASFVF